MGDSGAILRGPINKLTDTKIESKLKEAQKAIDAGSGKPILLGDGGGLTLQITKSGTASWLYRYMRLGKAMAIGLGPYPSATLKIARAKAEACRRQVAAGEDPLAAKRSEQSAQRLSSAKGKTFDECAQEYIADHRDEWKNPKHIQQWENTLATYASPIIGKRPIAEITTADLKRILSNIWKTKHETASRLRGRIEAVIDWATAHGIRTGDNPARWKGHLEHLLAKSTAETRATKHHAALPHARMPQFFEDLKQQEGMARWALEFLVLTASRTSEVTGATIAELDLEKKIWVIPKERMKAGKEHRVPLSDGSIAAIEAVLPFSNGTFLFPGGKADKPLSNMAMSMLLRRMGYEMCTVHGFRSTFADFSSELTIHDLRTVEEALAHKLQDKVAAAYNRSDLFDKRIALMMDWQRYCYTGVAPARPASTQRDTREVP